MRPALFAQLIHFMFSSRAGHEARAVFRQRSWPQKRAQISGPGTGGPVGPPCPTPPPPARSVGARLNGKALWRRQESALLMRGADPKTTKCGRCYIGDVQVVAGSTDPLFARDDAGHRAPLQAWSHATAQERVRRTKVLRQERRGGMQEVLRLRRQLQEEFGWGDVLHIGL